MNEEIRSIPGFPEYEVSESGQVRRRLPSQGSRCAWLKASITTGGYPLVNLCRNGRGTSIRVYRLVAWAFLGPQPVGMHVAHNDGNPLNSHWTNLRYATPRDNNADKVRHGTQKRGENVYNAKLSNADVEAIRAEYQPRKGAEIARRYGVNQSTIWRIVKGGRRSTGVAR